MIRSVARYIDLPDYYYFESIIHHVSFHHPSDEGE